MNILHIVGNLTNDPEKRSTADGTPVTNFTVAVNRRNHGARAGQPEADYFRVTAWRKLAENCVAYLSKGRKVAVTGSVSVSTHEGRDGKTRAYLEVTADDVEFLTPKNQQPMETPSPVKKDAETGYAQVDDDELPF